MSDARLPAALEAAAIRRSVEASGGFAAILHKGDADRGSLLLLVRQRGAHITVLERAPQADRDGPSWQRGGPTTAGEGEADLREFLAKRLRFDPDCWLIELDIPDSERFVVEILAAG